MWQRVKHDWATNTHTHTHTFWFYEFDHSRYVVEVESNSTYLHLMYIAMHFKVTEWLIMNFQAEAKWIHDLLSFLSSYSALRGLGSLWAIIYFYHIGSKSETLSSEARLTFAVILQTWQSIIEGNHFTEPLFFFLTLVSLEICGLRHTWLWDWL